MGVTINWIPGPYIWADDKGRSISAPQRSIALVEEWAAQTGYKTQKINKWDELHLCREYGVAVETGITEPFEWTLRTRGSHVDSTPHCCKTQPWGVEDLHECVKAHVFIMRLLLELKRAYYPHMKICDEVYLHCGAEPRDKVPDEARIIEAFEAHFNAANSDIKHLKKEGWDTQLGGTK